VAGDEAIKQILINNPYKYIKHPASVTIAAGLLGLGLVFSEGAEHAKQRKAFSPAFSSQSIRDLTPIFWQKSFLLCNLWRKQIDAVHRSAHVEALQWLTRATLDMIGEAGFGQDINSLENPDAPIRQAYLKFLGVDIAARINHGLRILISVAKHIPTPANNILEASRQIIFNEATRIVHEKAAQAREGKAMRGDIISRITKDNFKLEEGGQEGLSIETMRDQSIGFESMEIFSPADAPRI
jgi:cytochrome P450